MGGAPSLWNEMDERIAHGPAFRELGAGREGEKREQVMQNVIVYDGIQELWQWVVGP